MRRRNRNGRKIVIGGTAAVKAANWGPGTVTTCCRRNRRGRPIRARAVPLQYRFRASATASRNCEKGWEEDEQHADRIPASLRSHDENHPPA